MAIRYDYDKLKKAARLDWFLETFYQAEVKREGRNLYVCCIFHDEKSPSLHLMVDEGKFCCFGCKPAQKGDIFDLVMKAENLDRGAAVKRVAEYVGMSEEEYVIRDEKLPAPKPVANGKTELPAAVMFPGTRMPVTPFPLQEREQKQKAAPQKIEQQPKAPIQWPKNEGPRTEWTPRKLVDTTPYKNPDGTLRYEVLRYEWHEVGNPKNRDKSFSQRWKHEDGFWVWSINPGRFIKDGDSYIAFGKKREHKGREAEAIELPGIERILLNADLLLTADEVYLVEGEKDAKTLMMLGFVATTPSGGTNAEWLDSFTDQITGKKVIHIPDNDKSKKGANGEESGRQGQRFADTIQARIEKSLSEYIRVQLLSEYKDITEYLDSQSDDPDIRRELVERLVETEERNSAEKNAAEVGYISVTEAIALYPGGEAAYLDYTKRPKGVYTGFAKLDAMTMGLRPGEVFILAGRPAMGKSSLAENIGTNIARQGRAVTADWLEMDRISIATRQMCALADVNMKKFKANYLNPFQRQEITRAYELQKTLPFYHDDCTNKTLDQMFEKLLRIKKEHDLALHITDYLQLQDPTKPGEKRFSQSNRVQEISYLTRGFKLMARELMVPFLVLSQLSRGPETRAGDNRPMLSDLRESGSIEQDADMVGFIFREEVYRPDKQELRGQAELILAKQRNGPTGTINLLWRAYCTRFDNRPEDTIEEHQSQQAQEEYGDDAYSYGS